MITQHRIRKEIQALQGRLEALFAPPQSKQAKVVVNDANTKAEVRAQQCTSAQTHTPFSPKIKSMDLASESAAAGKSIPALLTLNILYMY